jgi:hypothetical protein
MTTANKADATNPAIAFLFHAGPQWRGVADPRRWLSIATHSLACAIIVLTGVVCLFLARGLSPHVVPLSIQYTGRIGSVNNEGPFPPGARFLVTNNSASALRVKLSSIEVRTGTGWTFHSALTIPLFTLPAHVGTYANIEPPVWPPGPWRIRGTAARELTGTGRAWAAVRGLARHLNSPSTPTRNPFARNPFAKTTHYYRGGYDVPSQEVPNP